MRRIRLILLPTIAGDPAPWLTVDASGQPLERGQLAVGDPPPLADMATVAIAPGADVLVRWLQVPGRTEAQSRAAALLLLQDELAADPERLTCALGPVPAPGEPRLTAVVSTSLVEAWSDHLAALGLSADVIVPDSLVPQAPEDDQTLNAIRFGPRLALRGRGFAAGVEPELAEAVAGGRRLAVLEDMAEIERRLIATALNPPVNLAPRLRRAARPGRWRIAAALAVAVALSPLVLAWAEAGRDEVIARDLNARSAALATTAFDDIPPGADPVAEARRRLSTLPPPGGPAQAASALFAAVEAVPGSELDSLVTDAAGVVRATLTYGAYADLEALKGAVVQRGLALTEQSVLEENGRIVADVIVGASA